MKTTVGGNHQLALSAVVIDEVKIVGSRCGPFEKAIQSLASGNINVDGLITDRFTLDRYGEAFQAADNANSFKVVFEIG